MQPAANELAEAFNKTIIKILKMSVSSSKRDWTEKPGECLSAYRTTVRNPIGNMPFSLVYERKVVLTLEIQIPSLRFALVTKMIKEDNHRLRLQELEMLDDKRLQA